jgi:hypothetical protein
VPISPGWVAPAAASTQSASVDTSRSTPSRDNAENPSQCAGDRQRVVGGIRRDGLLAFFESKRSAAPSVDGLMWLDYETDFERRIGGLHGRVLRRAYRAIPSQRQYIPKPDGRERPVAVAALQDKIVGWLDNRYARRTRARMVE